MTKPGALGGTAGPLFIRTVLAPDLVNGMCAYTDDPAQAGISVGAADVSFANLTTYSPEVLVGNYAGPDAGSAPAIKVTSTVTDVVDGEGGDIASQLATMCAAGDAAACATAAQLGKQLATPTNLFTTAASTVVGATTPAGAGYAPMAVTLVDAATVTVLRTYFQNALTMNGAQALRTEIQLLPTVQLVGATTTGVQVESQGYEFPVTFSYGSLVANLQPNPEAALGYCLDTMEQATTPQACVPGQEVSTTVSSVAGVPACSGS